MFQPVRWLSPPSVSQSYNAALFVCALTIAGCGSRPAPHARPQHVTIAAKEIPFFMINLARVVI
jgi:hypothetical protein